MYEAEELKLYYRRLTERGRFRAAIEPTTRACSILQQEFGASSLEYTECIDDLASLRLELEEYEMAEALYGQALRIKTHALGPSHPDVAETMSNLALVLTRRGRHDDAVILFEQALSMAEEALGSEHPRVADILSNIALMQNEYGDQDEAKANHERSLRIREQSFGPDHVHVAESLNNLAVIHLDRAEIKQAERLLERALSINETSLGTEHPSVAPNLNNLAELYRKQGHLEKARTHYERALKIDKATFGPTHLNVATDLNNLGMLQQEIGDYDVAEKLFKRALLIRENLLGPEHFLVASSHNNIASLYEQRGNYEQALLGHEHALSIFERTLESNHPIVAVSLNNIATILEKLGDYEKAAATCERALLILRRTHARSHPNVITIQINLAAVNRRRGLLAEAESLLEEALVTQDGLPNPSPIVLSATLNGLAGSYMERGAYREAERLYIRALAISEAVQGPRHPNTATRLVNLAGLRRKQGRFIEANALYRRALTIDQSTLGSEHPETAVVLRGLASTQMDIGRQESALDYLHLALHIEELSLIRALSIADDARRLAHAGRALDASILPVSLHLLSLPHNHSAGDLALLAILLRKERIRDMIFRSRVSLLNILPTSRRHLLDELAIAYARYSTLVHLGPDETKLGSHRARLAALERQQDDLWAELREVSPPFRAITAPITISAVQAQLPGDSALVEYVRYRAVLGPGTSKGTNELRYAAYILFPHRLDWVDLGPAAPIDAQIQAFRNDIILGTDVHASGRALHDSVMRPVIDRLGGVDHLFVAPDADLNLVPFDALVDEHSRFLVERFRLHTLTSGRDLLRPWMLEPAADGPVVVVANPAGADLPGTEHEATQLASLFHDTVRLQHDDATETRLRTQERPRILHLATHGTFGSGRPGHTLLDAPPDDLLPTGTSVFDGLPPSQLDNPMLYSWLDLAAPAAPPDGEPDEHADLDDGKLTAYEISGWDLRGTELVTLSACDTAQGTYQQGEGILGLRRAFAIAGAQTQVMSLWKVSDASTTALMATYYRRLLAGEGRSEAMRNTQLERLRNPETRHPRDWAAFVVIGEWGPLSGTTREGPEPIPPRPRGCQASVEPNVDALGSLALALVGLGTIRRRRRATGPERSHA